MARKKKLLLHIGPNPSGMTGLHGALGDESALLSTVDHVVGEIAPADLEAAGHEMLRTHKDAGLKRRDVEGSWSRICRRLLKARVDVIVSQPRFCTADDAQIALILDILAGLDVHVVITPEEDEDTDDLVAAWSRHLKTGRLHRAPLDVDAAPVDLAEELVGVVLCVQQQELDAKISKLKQRRKIVRKRIALRDAS